MGIVRFVARGGCRRGIPPVLGSLFGALGLLVGASVAVASPVSGGAGSSVPAAPACAMPGAPGTVGATVPASPAENQATVSWAAADGNGSTVTAYVVRATSGPNNGQSIATGGTATSVTMGGLGGGTPVEFSVAAESVCGTGPTGASNAVTPSGSASTYVTATYANHPSAYYRLSDTGGSVMADSSGNGADGQYNPGGSYTFGEPGAIPSDPDASLLFGNNGFGSASPPLPTGSGPRTVEAWINTENADRFGQGLLGYGANALDQEFQVTLGSNYIGIDGGGGDLQTVATNRSIDDGNWHLITVTYGGGTTATAYLDGQEIGVATLANPLNTPSSPLDIGSIPNGPANISTFVGYMQDVAVYPSAFSAAQVEAHFASSGYTRPTAPAHVHAAYGGDNGAQITWGASHATDTGILGYLVSVVKGANKGESETVGGDSTAAEMTGLAAGSQTFSVQPFDSFGSGPTSKSNSFTVPGTASTYDSQVLNLKPSIYYRLADSTTGGTACSAVSTTPAMADSSGHRDTGTYQCAVVGQGGALGNDAATSAGTPDTGQSSPAIGVAPVTADSAVPLGNSSRTIELWAQSRNPADYFAPMPLVAWGQSGTDNGFGIFEPSPQELVVSAAGDDHTFETPYPLDDGTWHQIAVTYDGAHIIVYVDGKPIGAQAFNANVLDTLPGPVDIGATPFGIFGGDGWSLDQTNLADVAVYASALTSKQLTAQFAASGYARPAAPSGPSATAGTNSATVTWTAPVASDPPVEGYVVTALAGAAKKAANAESVPATQTSVSLSGLKGGTAYAFKVQALNAYGGGASVTTAASVTPTGGTSTYASTVLSDKPSAFYRLGDGASVAMADSSGSATGRYVAPDVTLGVSPGAISNDASTAVGNPNYSGNSDIFGTSPAEVPLTDQSRSVEVWLQLPTPCGGSDCVNPLVTWGTNNTDNGFEVAEFGSDTIFVSGGGSDTLSFTTPYPINDGAWHQIVVTYDGTTNTVTLYLDGVKVGSAESFSGALDTQPSLLGISELGGFIGNAQSSGGLNVDDVSVYPTVLSRKRVAAHYAASGNPAPAVGSGSGRAVQAALRIPS
jgi:Concanavalin A-like lectin/glucanases superfamily/Fibronectin type III domain